MNKLKNILFTYGYHKERFDSWFCRNFHRGIYYGGQDQYQCAQCFRKHPVPWGKLASKDKV